MQIDIRSNVKDVSRWLSDAEKKQIPFATVYAMTLTAREAKDEEISVMRRVFDRPTPYTLNALQVHPAKKTNMIAKVEFKEGFGGTPAKRFLNPEVDGGVRSQRSSERQIAPLLKGYSYLVPARGMALNSYGNVTGATMRKILSQLKLSVNSDANASNALRSRKKRKAQAYFIPKRGDMVMERKGQTVQPVLIGVRSPQYPKRFPFYQTAERVVDARFALNFEKAFESAMATSKVKGKWS